jgi:hypothetical protein
MALFNASTNEKGWLGGRWLNSPPYTLPHAQDFLGLPFDVRVRRAGEITVKAGLFPAYPYIYHLVRLLVFAAIPYAVFFPSFSEWQSFSDPIQRLELPFKKLVVWALVLEFCGFCTMSGPLGGGGALFDPLWFRFTPGTIKQPLIPSFPRTRSGLDVGILVCFLSSAGMLLVSSSPTKQAYQLTCVLHSLLCVLDRTAYTGAMGAYYWPLLFCLCFDDWMLGCQIVQVRSFRS